MKYDEGLRMAQAMKEKDAEIRAAILKTQRDRHGVVALRFSDQGREMAIEILDEPYESDVRVYPG